MNIQNHNAHNLNKKNSSNDAHKIFTNQDSKTYSKMFKEMQVLLFLLSVFLITIIKEIKQD